MSLNTGMVLMMIFSSARAMEKTSVYMKRSEISDQKMSGSGYSYNVHDGGEPLEYSFEVDGNEDALKIIRDLGYEPFPETKQSLISNPVPVPYIDSSDSELHNPVPVPSINSEQRKLIPVPYLDNPPVKLPVKPSVNKHKPSKTRVYSLPVVYPYPHIQVKNLGLYPIYPYAPGYNHKNNNFVKTSGKTYGESSFSQKGDKVDTGYNVLDAYIKGLHGNFDDQYAKAFHNQNGGKAHADFHKFGNNANKQSAGHVHRGGSFQDKDTRHKGTKTTGYHKVYHKDDYDKQHKFYDKADQRGHFKKYGDFKEGADSEAAKFAGGSRHADGHNANEYGKKEVKDQGAFDETAKGFQRGQGNEAFYKDYADYSKKGGNENRAGYGV